MNGLDQGKRTIVKATALVLADCYRYRLEAFSAAFVHGTPAD